MRRRAARRASPTAAVSARPPRLCAADPECWAIGWCLETGNLDREQACIAAHDAGLDAALAYRGLQRTSCLDECAVGSQWYCVGHGAPPSPAGQDTAVTVSLFDTFTNKPTADASVAVCAQIDPTCSTILSSATSDADGGATVTVPRNVTGYGATGYLSISGAALMPELVFWGFPLSEPRLTEFFGTLTTTEASAGVLTSVLGVPVDLTRALVVVNPTDCRNDNARNVAVSITPSDPDTRTFYYSTGSSFTSDGGTGPTGLALIVNVPVDAGAVTVKATPAQVGQPSSVVHGFTRAGTVTGLFAPVNQ